jgi:hypothetical protein
MFAYHFMYCIVHSFIGVYYPLFHCVQIPLCNLFGLQFEVIYFLNSRSFLLAWLQITSVASKLFDMVQV